MVPGAGPLTEIKIFISISSIILMCTDYSVVYRSNKFPLYMDSNKVNEIVGVLFY